ncbi:LOW QUALITY PROTEIN: Protein CBG19761 [Caenorhabditis briggsae]|uniref:Protein CBG19761 n=1 Tax=Caenorhabditis briggsae TaxID=6238 RepID=E3CU72_CAEBR|nr:LOW QUALITY PROTEIN: Protein CBG19761 [Caenorhabditis briggsae]CBX32993.1 Protein CBG19761 [Caenorhabditis briggsae]
MTSTRSARKVSDLYDCDWYWGDLDWKWAERLLLLCPVGYFLIRDSRSETHLFTVSYHAEDKVYHSRLSLEDSRQNLGSRRPYVSRDYRTLVKIIERSLKVDIFSFFQNSTPKKIDKSIFKFPEVFLAKLQKNFFRISRKPIFGFFSFFFKIRPKKSIINFFQQSLHGHQMLHFRRGFEADAAHVHLTSPLTKRELLPSLQYLCRFAYRSAPQAPPIPQATPPAILTYLNDSKWVIPDLLKCEEQLKRRFR